MNREPIQLLENTPSRPYVLDSTERRLLAERIPDLRITPSVDTDGAYLLTATQTIGLTMLGDRLVEIRSRLGLDRVLFLASYAIEGLEWPATNVDLAGAPDLVDAVGRLFSTLTLGSLRRGLLHGYVPVEEQLSTVRGRIRFSDQISRWNGMAPPVEVSYEDYTVDVPENRILKAAALRLARLGTRSPRTAGELRRIRRQLAEVSTVPMLRATLPEVRWTRLNEHYRPAVELARLILCGLGVEAQAGQTTAPSFLLNMPTVFERFVQRALRASLGLDDRTFPENSRGHRLRLDTGGAVRMYPDLSWWEGPTCRFVGDCKYKRTDSAVKHADLYQLLAYTIATGVAGGLLVYADGEAPDTDHEVAMAGKTLLVRTLDLRGTPDDILGQVGDLASLVHDLARPSLRAVS